MRYYEIAKFSQGGKKERERNAWSTATCGMCHPGASWRDGRVGSAGRWFANYLNLPKPQPRRPRKPQLPSSWPPLAASHSPFLLSAIPLFLSPQPPSDYPFPLRLPIYVSSFLLTLAPIVVIFSKPACSSLSPVSRI